MYSGLIAALGNPGNKYHETRHNMGFMFAEALRDLANKNGTVEELSGKKFHSQLWRISLPQLPGHWLLAEPQTFMNESGRAVQPLLAWHNLKPEQLIVVHDEMDIPAGHLRFKFGGGLAGHNGLASMAACLGTRDFYRLRIGIGKPLHKEDTLAWVLGRQNTEDRHKIREIIPYALKTVEIFAQKGLQPAIQFAHGAAAELDRQRKAGNPTPLADGPGHVQNAQP